VNKNDDIKKTTWIDRFSKGERYFWFTIAILLLCHLTLHFFAMINLSEQETELSNKKQPVLYEIILSDNAKKNLELASPILLKNMNIEIEHIQQQVDNVFDHIFQDIKNNNMDKFLDFHYSVMGEYTELGAMATGKIGKTIQEKLLGTDFKRKIQNATSQIDNEYIQAMKRHSSFIEHHAYQNVDMNLNSESIAAINNEIQKNISQQGGKIGVLLSARLIPKIVATISAKLAAKVTGKIALKAGAKLAAKSASSLTGASAGSICGPAIIICSPVFAVTAWFTTDAIITKGDESLNRKQFKAEIISLLNQQNQLLKNKYKNVYSQSLEQFSKDIKNGVSDVKTKEKVRIKDKISNI